MSRQEFIKNRDVRALALLWVSVPVFFWPLALSPSHILFSGFSDLIVMRTGWQELIRKSVFETGSIPLWNPHVFCGVPFIGNPGCWAFYPLNWLFVLLPVNLSSTLLVISHLAAGATGVYAWLRGGLRIQVWPALLGALYFTYGGKLLLHVLVPGHLGFLPLIWIPWALLAVDVLVRKGRWTEVGALATALGLMGVSLFTQLCFYSAIFITAYFVFRLVDCKSGWTTRAVQFVCAGLLAGCLSAVQLFPVWDMAGESARAAFIDFSFASTGSLGWTDFGSLLRPSSESLAGWSEDVFGWEKTFQLGLLPLLMVVFAFGGKERRREFWFCVCCSCLVLLHALGRHTPFFPFLFHWIPGFGYFRVPTRAMFFLSFCVAGLVGLGADALMYSPSPCRRNVALLMIFILVVAAFWVGGSFWLAEAGPWLMVSAAFCAAAIGIPRLPQPSVRFSRRLLTLAVVVETWSFAQPFLMTRDMDEVFDISRLQSSPFAKEFNTDSRVAEYDREVFHTFFPEYLLVRHGGYDLNGFNPMIPLRYVKYMARITNREPRPEVWIPGLKPSPYEPLLDLLNLKLRFRSQKFEEDPGRIQIIRSQEAMPRACIVKSHRTVSNSEEMLDELTTESFNPRLEILLEDEAPPTSGKAQFKPIKFDLYSPDLIELTVSQTESAWLLLSESWHAGWKCYATRKDGTVKEKSVYRANYLLRAVRVEPGETRLVFRFKPESYRAGLAVTLLGLIILAFLFLSGWFRRTHQKQNETIDDSAASYRKP